MKFLIADSDPKTLESVGMCCSIRWPHREILSTADAEELLNLVEQEVPDLVLLDSDMPGESGYALCREIRSFSTVPLIMTCSVADEEEVIRALDSGADDCVGKPLRPLELLARIIALLRRTQSLPLVSSAQPFISGDLYIDFDTYEVRIDGDEVRLTFTEFEILRCLVNNSRRVISHSQLACLVWGEDGQGSRNSLKVHIQHLRNKLGESAHDPRYILNERGFGYKFAARR
ncbi:MAG: response regulator transcription factor [Dehalococcoidia bacterium]